MTCPAPNCDGFLGTDAIACERHWLQVSPRMQGAVARARRNIKRARTPTRLLEHRLALKKAKGEIVEFLQK